MHHGLRAVTIALTIAIALVGCSTYGEKVAPVPMPAERSDAIDVDGAKIVARVYQDPDLAERAFGFDIRGAGLLPVQFVVDNRSGAELALQPEQILLADAAGQGWPLLSADTAAERVRASVAKGETVMAGARGSLLAGLAGGVIGAAVGIVTERDIAESAGKGAVIGGTAGAIGGGAAAYSDLGRKIRRDLARHQIEDRVVEDGELAYGFLFFPDEASGSESRSLRLGVRVGDTTRVVSVPVSVMAPLP